MFSQNRLQERLNSLSEHSTVCWGDLRAVVTARGRNTPALGTCQSQGCASTAVTEHHGQAAPAASQAQHGREIPCPFSLPSPMGHLTQWPGQIHVPRKETGHSSNSLQLCRATKDSLGCRCGPQLPVRTQITLNF